MTAVESVGDEMAVDAPEIISTPPSTSGLFRYVPDWRRTVNEVRRVLQRRSMKRAELVSVILALLVAVTAGVAMAASPRGPRLPVIDMGGAVRIRPADVGARLESGELRVDERLHPHAER